MQHSDNIRREEMPLIEHRIDEQVADDRRLDEFDPIDFEILFDPEDYVIW